MDLIYILKSLNRNLILLSFLQNLPEFNELYKDSIITTSYLLEANKEFINNKELNNLVASLEKFKLNEDNINYLKASVEYDSLQEFYIKDLLFYSEEKLNDFISNLKLDWKVLKEQENYNFYFYFDVNYKSYLIENFTYPFVKSQITPNKKYIIGYLGEFHPDIIDRSICFKKCKESGYSLDKFNYNIH